MAELITDLKGTNKLNIFIINFIKLKKNLIQNLTLNFRINL